MPMYWTFNCFLGCIYGVYHMVYVYSIFNSKLTFKSWILTSKKKGPSCPNWGRGGGGLGNSGNARKKTFFFFNWPLPLLVTLLHQFHFQNLQNVCQEFIVTGDDRRHIRLVGVGSLLDHHLWEHYLVDYSLEHACLPLVVITSISLSGFANCVLSPNSE